MVTTRGTTSNTSPPPTIHEAELVPGPSGAVYKGAIITFVEAVSRRGLGLDIVVCGRSLKPNRLLAKAIESAVGPPTRVQKPHKNVGLSALPHFHQASRMPKGHSFYETNNPLKKARKKP